MTQRISATPPEINLRMHLLDDGWKSKDKCPGQVILQTLIPSFIFSEDFWKYIVYTFHVEPG
jgi:hypothetical protein